MTRSDASVGVPDAEVSGEAGVASVLDGLKYRTVAEALRVAARVAQSAQHRAFCDRVGQFQSQLSPKAIQVLEQIESCGIGRVRSTPKGLYRVERERCRHPVCPTCGIRSRNRELPRVIGLFQNGKEAFGDDAVSFVTVNMEPCSPSHVRAVVSVARVALRNIFGKGSLNVRIEGEFEFAFCDETAQKTRRRARGWSAKLGEGSKTTPPLPHNRSVKPHLHAIVVHPGISRRRLSRLLGPVFKSSTGDQAVRVEQIRDRVGAGGRWVNGPDRVVKYFLDKAAAVKGEQRSGDVLSQIVAFEAYVRLSGGQRRRPRLRLGRLAVPRTLRASAMAAPSSSRAATSDRPAAAAGCQIHKRLPLRDQMRALARRSREPRTQPACSPPAAS
jgi:hypothetical protein